MISIIPAIDIIGGRCVRLTQGNYDSSKEYGDPLDLARTFEDAGCTRLHLVDLDGARASHIVNHRTLQAIASHTSLVIDFGGGVKSDDDLRIAFECGATMVTGGSIAVKQPDLFVRWVETHGGDRIVLGADARDGKIATNGWHENSDIDLLDFIAHYTGKGVTQAICTDISCDGTLQGPSTALYSKIKEKFPQLHLIASGGIGSMAAVAQLDAIGIAQVIVGKAIYENRISMKDIERLNLQN